MKNFIETIKIENREIELFELHRARMQATALAHNFKAPEISTKELLDGCRDDNVVIKCRIEYSNKGILSIDYSQYTLRNIRSLKLVNDNNIQYDFKYSDRSQLNNLTALKGDYNDIIIVKDGLVTDCSYANLVFVKDYEYFTPQSYLLNGTRRRDLLAKKQITECEIKPSDIHKYDSVMLINGMIKLGEVSIDCENIF